VSSGEGQGALLERGVLEGARAGGKTGT